MAELFVANTTFSTEYDGGVVVVRRGATRVREGHPIYTANPQYFDRVDLVVHYEWEDAAADSRSGGARQPDTVSLAPSGGVTNANPADAGGQSGNVADTPTEGSRPAEQPDADAKKPSAKKPAAKRSAALEASASGE